MVNGSRQPTLQIASYAVKIPALLRLFFSNVGPVSRTPKCTKLFVVKIKVFFLPVRGSWEGFRRGERCRKYSLTSTRLLGVSIYSWLHVLKESSNRNHAEYGFKISLVPPPLRKATKSDSYFKRYVTITNRWLYFPYRRLNTKKTRFPGRTDCPSPKTSNT